MTQGIQDKVIVITGASSGLGEAAARPLSAQGARIALGARRATRKPREWSTAGARAAALDYAKANIRMNAVCPGISETPMMDRFSGGAQDGRARVIAQEPVGRMGRPDEIAAAVVWLCLDAGFVVGHGMGIDGGQAV